MDKDSYNARMTFMGNSDTVPDEITPRNYEYDNVARIFDVEKGAQNFDKSPKNDEIKDKKESQNKGQPDAVK